MKCQHPSRCLRSFLCLNTRIHRSAYAIPLLSPAEPLRPSLVATGHLNRSTSMADNTDDKPTAAKAPTKAGDTIETMQKQIGQMRREISSLKRMLADQAEEVVEDAEGWFETASEGAARATRAVRSQAQTVSGVVQENPGTVSSALLSGASSDSCWEWRLAERNQLIAGGTSVRASSTCAARPCSCHLQMCCWRTRHGVGSQWRSPFQSKRLQ